MRKIVTIAVIAVQVLFLSGCAAWQNVSYSDDLYSIHNKIAIAERQKAEAELAKAQYQGALRLFPLPESEWRPQVYTCSSLEGTGLEEVWQGVEQYLQHIELNGYFMSNRNRQNKYWMYETINETLKSSFYNNPEIEAKMADIERRVLDAKLSSFIAAKELLDIYFNER